MSEPSSLYMLVTLTEDSYSAFMSSPLIAPRAYDDWLPWLKASSYSGAIMDSDIQAIEPPTAAQLNAQANMLSPMGAPRKPLPFTDPVSIESYLSLTFDSPFYGPARAHYDGVGNVWTLIITQCSENYLEFIGILAILRTAASYKDLPGDDFILIYPYLWGGPPEACVAVNQGGSQFVAGTPGHIIEEANLALGTLLNDSGFGSDADADL